MATERSRTIALRGDPEIYEHESTTLLRPGMLVDVDADNKVAALTGAAGVSVMKRVVLENR